ncbi:unnamed protein product [marine sediment metagenome]|uniref:Uncharacterized protein n=1 Tax=marine sediment metagenome TaxID=412755 RepID=X1D1C5_9ZZZZ
MNDVNRLFEFEALVAEGQIIAIAVQGMRFENEQRIHLGQNMAYQEDSFHGEAAKLQVVTNKLRALKI